MQKTMGVAIIGLGSNGLDSCRGVLTRPNLARLVAGADPDAAQRDRARRELSVEVVDDYRQLLNRPDIDVVKVCTPNRTHAQISIDFLAAGKHVCCEKPMAMTLADCQRMLDARDKSGRNLVIGFEVPFSSFFRRIGELLDQNAVGALKAIHFYHSRGGWGQKAWALDRSISGGAIMECPIHEVDLFRILGGDVEWVEVFAAPPSLPWYSREVPDHFVALFQFKSGATASMTVFHNRCATTVPADVTPNDEFFTNSGHEMKLSIMGDAGAIEVDFWKQMFNIYAYEPQSRHVELVRREDFSARGHNDFDHNVSGFLLDFIERCAQGRTPAISADDSYKTMAITMAAEASIAHHGRRIRMEEFERNEASGAVRRRRPESALPHQRRDSKGNGRARGRRRK